MSHYYEYYYRYVKSHIDGKALLTLQINRITELNSLVFLLNPKSNFARGNFSFPN